MIEARGLSKRFHDKKRGEIRAVDHVSFRCEPGRIYGLLGANGAGKTTTLRILATILEPSEGTALICGHDVVEEPEKSHEFYYRGGIADSGMSTIDWLYQIAINSRSPRQTTGEIES